MSADGTVNPRPVTAPVIDDLSSYIIAGRVKAKPAGRYETDERSPAQGVDDGVVAESIGLRRIFLAERWNLKEAGVILGAIGARTTRVGLATGVVPTVSRNPLAMAALGSTLTAVAGNRVLLGLGRGSSQLAGTGLGTAGFRAFVDYVSLLKRLWAGETVTYDGPIGRFHGLALGDLHDGSRPELWMGTFGLQKAATAAARSVDGVMLMPGFTPEATARCVETLGTACERIGRDPSTLRIAQPVITAPDLDDTETRQIAHARMTTYLQPASARAICELNGWDPDISNRLNAALGLSGIEDGDSDLRFHRIELVEASTLIPDSWIADSCAVGSVAECANQLARFRAAGADEIITYGSTPARMPRLRPSGGSVPPEGEQRNDEDRRSCRFPVG